MSEGKDLELKYFLLSPDLAAYQEFLLRDERKGLRFKQHLRIWRAYLFFAACIYVGVKHDEPLFWGFSLLFLIAIAFGNRTETQVTYQARQFSLAKFRICEHRLVVSSVGFRCHFKNLELAVPWSEIASFAIVKERVFIRFGTESEAFIIPVRYLGKADDDGLIETLRQHQIKEREKAP